MPRQERWQFLPSGVLREQEAEEAAAAWARPHKEALAKQWGDLARSELDAVVKAYGSSLQPAYPGQLIDDPTAPNAGYVYAGELPVAPQEPPEVLGERQYPDPPSNPTIARLAAPGLPGMTLPVAPTPAKPVPPSQDEHERVAEGGEFTPQVATDEAALFVNQQGGQMQPASVQMTTEKAAERAVRAADSKGGRGAIGDALMRGVRSAAPGVALVSDNAPDVLGAIDQGLKTAGRFLGERVVEAGKDRRGWYDANGRVFEALNRGEEPSPEDTGRAFDPEMVLMMTPESIAPKVGGVGAATVKGLAQEVLQRARGTAEQADALRPQAEGFAANINLAPFPEEVRPVIQRAVEAVGPFAGQRRGVVTDDEALKAAAEKALGTPVDSWLKTRSGKAFSQTEAIALGQAMTHSAQEYSALRETVAAARAAGTATPQMEAQLAEKALEFGALSAVRSGAAAEAGRALRSFQQALTGTHGGADRAIAEAFRRLGGSEQFAKWQERFDAIPADDVVGRAQMVRGLYDPGWWKRLDVLRYSSMLSSTLTHWLNALSNTARMAQEIPERAIAAGIDAGVSKVKGGERSRYLAEVDPLARATPGGMLAGLKRVPTILTTGIDPADATKLDARPGFAFAQTKAGQAVGEKASAVVDAGAEMPLRMLAAGDAIFRSGAMAGQAASIATRKAIREGLTGQARQTRVTEILANPGEHPDVFIEASDNAARVVYQETREATGAVGKVTRLPVVNWFVPFLKTPWNVAAQGLERTPAGLYAVVKNAREGKRGAAVDAASRVVFGTAIGSLSYGLAKNDLMTGMYPADEKERSTLPQGWKPWSLKLPLPDGGTAYVPVVVLGNLAIPMAIGATLADLERAAADPAAASEAVLRSVGAIGRFMEDQAAMQGVANLLKLLEDPKRYAEQTSEGIATQFVPYGAAQRQIQRILGMPARDPKGVLEALLATSPLTADQVPTKLDRLGNTVEPGQKGLAALLAPVRYDIERDTPALKTLRDAGVGLPGQPKERAGLALDDDEQRAFLKDSGVQIEAIVRRLNANPQFRALPPDVKREILEGAVSDARDQATGQMFGRMGSGEIRKRLVAPR